MYQHSFTIGPINSYLLNLSPNISEQQEDGASKVAVTSFDQIQLNLPPEILVYLLESFNQSLLPCVFLIFAAR